MPITRRHTLLGASLLGGLGLLGLTTRRQTAQAAQAAYPVTLTDAQWHARLSPQAYGVLREQDTEMPFSSPLDAQFAPGRYLCAGCANPLFTAATKYDSHTGWPSFWQVLPHAIAQSNDSSLGMDRTEVHCARCGGHLGHVFPDGPPPTGLRYCMNGVALQFRPA